jgi:tetratricopeptide (TPR) repeat protein
VSGNLSTAEVARILGLKEARIREIARAGLCQPVRRGRSYAFRFQDLVVLRAAKGLLDRGVPAARVRRALSALARALPAERPLSGLRIFADGRWVAVCERGSAWQPETGQTLLAFEVDALADQVEAASRAREAAAPSEAARAFQEALDLDGVDAAAACATYRRALALDPEQVDAWVNLGRLLHEGGDPAEAARLYREALARNPDDAIVHFNLALALEDLNEPDAARAHYERALALDPDFADAHYNLASLSEQQGRAADALRHYRAYKRLTET